MEKSKILAVGCGGCGCNQLDVFLGLDKRYTGVFMNTNLSEMENLKFFDRKRRCFYIANADGTGKNRTVAEEYIKEEAPKFAEMIKKFINQDVVYFFSSMNGGTGSKAIILLPYIVKNLCPEKSLNIVATFPSLTESDLDFENTIDTWNELIALKNKKIIDSIQFIDNNKCSNEQEVNLRAMKELNEGFEVVGGKLDSSDTKRVHCSNGYKVVLKLDNKIRDINDAIDVSMKSSVFYMPEKFNCDGMIGNINKNDFDINSMKKDFEVYGFSKFNNGDDGNNVIVFGGCEMPKEAIELTKEALKEMKNKKSKRVVQDDLIVQRENTNKNRLGEEEVETKSKLSSKDLDDLFADDNFWDI
ncbi:TPA: hypothetical protein PTV31_003191 [Clostridium botulinum]|nr:hypothetical protein [Clostridium botulinum]